MIYEYLRRFMGLLQPGGPSVKACRSREMPSENGTNNYSVQVKFFDGTKPITTTLNI